MSAPKPPGRLSPEMRAAWLEVTADSDSQLLDHPSAIEALCSQIVTMREARSRIESDGLIVADARGVAAPHPAIAIEKAASSEIRMWLSKYG